jgi:hypothetical protein
MEPDGTEGVDGASPSEGFEFSPAQPMLPLSLLAAARDSASTQRPPASTVDVLPSSARRAGGSRARRPQPGRGSPERAPPRPESDRGSPPRGAARPPRLPPPRAPAGATPGSGSSGRACRARSRPRLRPPTCRQRLARRGHPPPRRVPPPLSSRRDRGNDLSPRWAGATGRLRTRASCRSLRARGCGSARRIAGW